MLWSIISQNDIFYTPPKADNSIRPSNPYNYIRCGYFLDNASLFGGKDYVSFNGNISGNSSGGNLDIPNI